MRMLKLSLLFACTVAFAGDLLPLQGGNYWMFREVNGARSFTVRVGTQLSTPGAVYTRLIGYVTEPVWVRYNESGSLVYLDEENSREVMLTSFESAGENWGAAPLRQCEQESQVDARGQGYDGPLGRFESATHLRYRSFGCADAGVETEVYLPNIGLVRRSESSIAGPKVFELAEARVGGLLFSGKASGNFNVSLHQVGPENPHLLATLRLSLMSDENVILHYPTSQEYDIVMWNDRGEEVYRWSAGKFFEQSTWHREVSGMLRHTVEIPLQAATGEPLPAGLYAIHAWLTAGPGGQSCSALVNFRVRDLQVKDPS